MKRIFILVLCTLFNLAIFAQPADPPITMKIEPYKKGEIPNWAQDLRRAEIITLGTMPFAMLTVNLVTSVVRWAQSGFQSDGFPNPINPAPSTGDMAESEIWMNLLIAGGISLVIGITDFVIQQIKRSIAKKVVQDPTQFGNIKIEPIIKENLPVPKSTIFADENRIEENAENQPEN